MNNAARLDQVIHADRLTGNPQRISGCLVSYVCSNSSFSQFLFNF